MPGVLADLVVMLHLGWILFLLLGAAAGRRWAWVKRIHLAGLGFAVVFTAGGWICPLTYLEVWLRRSATGAADGYPGSFVGHYAERLVYLDVPRGMVSGAVLGVVALSWWAYTAGRRTRQP